MSERVKWIIGLSFLFSIFGISWYANYCWKNEIERSEQRGVAITYDYYILGTGSGTIRYFFNTPNGIYTGTSQALNFKYPGYYYKIRYSGNDPTISELLLDSIVPDSIGLKHIRMNEIVPTKVVNADQVPNWQWHK